MKEHNIDDLLKVVSPEFVAHYERTLGGATLDGVNKEYKRAAKDPSAIIDRWIKWFVITIVVGIVLSILSALFLKEMLVPVALTFAVVYVLNALYIPCFASKKIDKSREILSRCTPILKDFRAAVESLNPLGITIHEYNEKTAWRTLVTLAARVLDAEIKFDASRKQEERMTWDILHYGNWLQKCQKEFDKTSQCVRDFGTHFSTAKVFAEAKEELVQEIRFIAPKSAETET